MMIAPCARGFKRTEGDTLIEVMVALSLLATAVLGSVALQSWVTISQQSARWLDIAVSTAAMVAEALRAGESPNTSLRLADNAVVGLPDGRTSLTSLGDEQWRIAVAWSEPRRWEGADQKVGNDGRRDGGLGRSLDGVALGDASCPTSKGEVGAGRVPRCISLVLVR